MALATHHLIRCPTSLAPASAPARPVSKSGRSSCFSPINFSASAKNQEGGGSGGGGGRRVWRRRKLALSWAPTGYRASRLKCASSPLTRLVNRFWYMSKTKKDDKLRSLVERVPFLEERVRNIRDTGEILSMDIDRLMLSQENRFDFVNEVAAEATAYLENNRLEYGVKKPILHVISNRMNEAGFYRPEAYMEVDPFKPGPNFLKEELYD